MIAIKPISAGSWKPGETRTRNNAWSRPPEEQEEINRAIPFALFLDPVVTAIPTSFLNLNERAIHAEKTFQPATARDLAALEALAAR